MEKQAKPTDAEHEGKPKKARIAPVGLDILSTAYQPTLADLQNLLLRVFTLEYGENPKWVCVRGMGLIRTARVFLVPCLDSATIRSSKDSAPALAALLDGPGVIAMRSAAEVEHFPDRGIHRAACRMLRTLFSAKAKPPVTCKRARPAERAGRAEPEAPRVPICAFMASAEELARSGYPSEGMARAPGWASTAGRGTRDLAAGPGDDEDRAKLRAIDCEMVMTASGSALARVSLLGPDGAVLHDSLVVPPEPVTDYLTEFSGITAEALASAQASPVDAQRKVLEFLAGDSILIGHSLENDLHALHLVHDRIVDTALLYPHPRGWPHRHGLAHLTSHILKRKLDRSRGHDSVADARAALDLALTKFERGPEFGASSGNSAPLGRLLKAAGSRLTLNDAGAPSESPGAWHLEGCEVPGSPDVPEGCDGFGPADAAGSREVRITVLRGFEALCERRAGGGG
eukprot:CAMPEP_0168403412 /NCGR_PEP_ID=MMETSP0228-20121227/24114_1 /TAXON_ID=133427 /ORGANISM="Protoceratium reticulatum, Strain CCCM 535 (=CCMP 1889)" /LENGTH=457 /DNA_ID=CAMNT_0008417011 /DNA_START=151 /DNA_END=1520 /DNA_ORIENTATION=+